MRFDNEQIGQFREIVTEAVTKIVAEAEERIVKRITASVAEMIEDNILPQFQEIRDYLTGTKVELKHDIAVLQRDMTEVKYDIGSLKRDVTGFRVGRVQLAA